MGLVLCQTGTVRHRAEMGHASPADHGSEMPRVGRAAFRPQLRPMERDVVKRSVALWVKDAMGR
jgi:hypothetical protein